MVNKVYVDNAVRPVAWNDVPDNRVNSVEIEFSFSDEWKDLICVAEFVQGKTCIPQLISGGKCIMPAELKHGYVTLTVFGNKADGSAYKATTIKYEFPIYESGLCTESTPPVPPSPDLYEQLIAEFLDMSTKDVDQIFNALSSKAQSGVSVEQARKKAVDEANKYTDEQLLNFDAIKDISELKNNIIGYGVKYGTLYKQFNGRVQKVVCYKKRSGACIFLKLYFQGYFYVFKTYINYSSYTNLINFDGSEYVKYVIDEDTEELVTTKGKITNDYSELVSKPSINGVELLGNKTAQELGLISDSPIHTTLNVEIENDGFGGYRADYNDNDINNHRNAGGLVQAKYYDMAKNQTYTYYYSTMESDRKPTFIRTYINEQGQTEQVLASVGNDKKVSVERRVSKGVSQEYVNEKLSEKVDHSVVVVNDSVITQADARDVLEFFENYSGALIEFVSSSLSRTVGFGWVISNTDIFLITIDYNGIITKWHKDSFEKHYIESYSYINEVVDVDNLTVDVAGNAPFMASVNNAFNRPFKEITSEKGKVFVIPYAIDCQVQVYMDMKSMKMYSRLVEGTADNHSFGTWQEMGGVSQTYVDQKAAETLASAKDYADSKDKWIDIFDGVTPADAVFEVDQKPDSTPFKLKKIRIHATIPQKAELSTPNRFVLSASASDFNFENFFATNAMGLNRNDGHASIYGEIQNEWKFEGVFSESTNPVNVQSIGFFNKISTNRLKGLPIEAIRLNYGWTGAIPSGTHIQIWGVEQ